MSEKLDVAVVLIVAGDLCKSRVLFLVVFIALMCSVQSGCYFSLSYLFKAFLENLVLGALLGRLDPQDPVDFQVKRVCPSL